MGQVAVIIPTTQGLSRVQQVRVDEQLRHAVMTVNFRTERASVTSDYAEYVARDAGIISRLTHEHRYRVKISRDIVTGSSWKLGMLAAHLLQHADLLAQADAPAESQTVPADIVGEAERVIWATGDVSDEYGVIPVAQVALKLEQSHALFEWCVAQSIPIDVFVPSVLDSDPKSNEQAERGLTEIRSRFPSVRIHKLEQAPKDTRAWLSPGHAVDPPVPPEPRRWLTPSLLVLGIAAASGIALAVTTGGSDVPSPEAPGGDVSVTNSESEREAADEEQASDFYETEEEAASVLDSDPPAATPPTEIEILTTLKFHPEGACFEDRENAETITRSIRPAGRLTLDLPRKADICGLEVATTGIALDRVSLRMEGGRTSADRDRDIAADDVQSIKNQVFQSPRFNRLVYEIVGQGRAIDATAQIAITFTGEAGKSEGETRDP